MVKKLKQTYFEDKWLVDPRFTKWIEKLSDNTIFGCKFCKKKGIKLSNMGIQWLFPTKVLKHMKSGKRKIRNRKVF